MAKDSAGIEVKVSQSATRHLRFLFIGLATVGAQLLVGYLANQKTVEQVSSLSEAQMQTLRLEREQNFVKKTEFAEMNQKLDRMVEGFSRIEGYIKANERRRRPGSDKDFWSLDRKHSQEVSQL